MSFQQRCIYIILEQILSNCEVYKFKRYLKIQISPKRNTQTYWGKKKGNVP